MAVTWTFLTGETKLFFDGVSRVPTYKVTAGRYQAQSAKAGGVDPHMAPQTLRLGNGGRLLSLSLFLKVRNQLGGNYKRLSL